MTRINRHDLDPIVGRYVRLREVKVSDAAFILHLRTTGRGAKFLNPTPNDISAQERYIRHYLELDNEWYFIVENLKGEPLGTVSAYNIIGDSIEIGRWVMSDGAKPHESLESDYLIKDFVFTTLDWMRLHCCTRLINTGIRNFNRSWNMTITDQNDAFIYFSLERSVWEKRRLFFERILGY